MLILQPPQHTHTFTQVEANTSSIWARCRVSEQRTQARVTHWSHLHTCQLFAMMDHLYNVYVCECQTETKPGYCMLVLTKQSPDTPGLMTHFHQTHRSVSRQMLCWPHEVPDMLLLLQITRKDRFRLCLIFMKWFRRYCNHLCILHSCAMFLQALLSAATLS